MCTTLVGNASDGARTFCVSKLILVSNRAPVTVRYEGRSLRLQRSSGGLVAGLSGPHEESEGTWIGWPGELPRLSAAQRNELEESLAKLRVVPVYLSRRDVKGFYEDVANSVLWPVFHYRIDQLPLIPEGWSTFTRVSEAFARAVIDVYEPGDRIWVHDYHLVLVPGLIRQALPDAKIGFFLHVPFPGPDVFSVLPWRREVLEGLLGADLIGFHTPADVDHFIAAARDLLRLPVTRESLTFNGRHSRVRAFPLGIDTRFWAGLARRPDVIERAREIRSEANGRKLLVGIDRLDYTKGILRRLTAMELLFKANPDLARRVRLIQVVFPSREGIESYAALRRRLDELIGRINSRYGTTAAAPVHVLSYNLSPEDVAALYQAADIMLVTPLRDGMNLVAKEFVASRAKDNGVLILSEFAGAANELTEAILVNPYDVEGMAATIRQALDLPVRGQRERMRSLRLKVMNNDVHAWAESFLTALDGSDAPAAFRSA
jgi:trehalose 6-phosphate synthase/phosphatase